METGQVFPETGQGPVFEPIVTPLVPGQLWRMVSADNLLQSGDPIAPVSCTPSLGLCEQLPPQPNDKLGDYRPEPTFVGPPHPMTVTLPGTRSGEGLAGPDKIAVCAPGDTSPISEGSILEQWLKTR